MCLWPATSRAEKQHKVRGGQTLGGIAKRYRVTKWSVAGLNGIDPETAIKIGDVLLIPDRGVVYINPGQTLWRVARRHNTTVKELARVNKIKENSSLRPGQRLVLPGYKPKKGERADWGKPKHPGRLSLYRVATGKKLSVSAVDSRGRVRKPALNQLARFLAPRRSKKTKRPDRRLVATLARVSDHFGGRRIDVISGYRTVGGYTGPASRHVAGAAVDFRIRGVPKTVLRDYCRTLRKVGCGYYPNSTFVHMDVRKRDAYWVDVSRPGQRPEYVDPAEFRATRATPATKGAAQAPSPAQPPAAAPAPASPTSPARPASPATTSAN